MKKITFFLFAVFIFNIGFSQCINTTAYLSPTADNSGANVQIGTCTYSTEYNTLSGLTVGEDYMFYATLAGVDGYVTITDASDVVIAHGPSPLDVLAITSATIRLHVTEDAACTGGSNCHVTGYQNLTAAANACPDPTNFTASNIDDVSAELSWSEPGVSAVSYNVEVYATGESAGGGNTPVFSDAAVTGTMVSATGLSESTDYDAYITTACSGTTTNSMLVGPLAFTTTASCSEVTGVGVTNISATDAEVTWTPGTGNDAATVEVYASGESAANGDTPVYTNAAASGGTDTATGLMGLTDYDVYITGLCGATTTTVVGPVTFTTECDTFTAPYSEDFENGGAAPSCWSVDTGAENWVFADDGGDHVGNAGDITGSTASGGYYAYVDASGSDANAILLSPLVDVSGLTTPSLSFYIISDNEGNANSQLDVDVWDGAAWNLVATYNTNTTGWELQTLDLSGLTFTGVAQVRYTFTEPTSGDFYDDIAIDDFMIDELPTCIVPGGLSANATSLTEATISWSAGASAETAWNYEYGVTGFTQGTGTTGSVATTPTVDLTMLTSGETYDFYVQADCGGGDTSNWIKVTWTQPSLGETCAAPIDLIVAEVCATATPYTLDYSTAVDLDPAPSCGSTWQTNVGQWFAFQPITGGVFVNTSDSNEIAIYDACGGTEIVCNSTPATSHEVTGLTPGSTYYLAVWKNSVTSGTTDICIEAILCSNPSDMAGDSISNTSASLTWSENGTATEWNVEWKAAADFTPGNMEEDGSANPMTTPTVTLSPLTSNTEYYVYYQAVCFGGAFNSDWIGPFVFTTACDPFTAPYSENFENTGSVPACWSADSGDESWLFSDNGGDHVGNGGTITGNTASGGYFAYVDSSGTSDDAILLSPFVDLSTLTTPTLTFYIISDNEGNANSNLDVEIWDGAAWNLVSSNNTNTNGWELRVVDLSGLTFTGNAQARFTITEPTPGDFYDDIAIDDVSFNEPPACTAAAAMVSIVNDCANSQFSIDVDVTDLGDSTAITISNDAGVAATTGVNALGVVTVGPFPVGTPVEITLEHESDTDCNIILGSYIDTCPPSNDDIATPIAITVDEGFCDGTNTNGTTTAASGSGEGAGTCFVGGANDDVWFTFTVPAGTATVDVSTDYTGGTNLDTQIAVYSGTPGSLVQIGCDQDSGTTVLSNGSSWNSLITDLAVTVGETYYVQVDTYNTGTANAGSFCLSVDTNQVLSIDNLEKEAAFTYYPNPVNNMLSLRAQNTIDNVTVYNMLGQAVLKAQPNNVNGEIDMTRLQSGAYFVEVTISNITKTVRVIKQ